MNIECLIKLKIVKVIECNQTIVAKRTKVNSLEREWLLLNMQKSKVISLCV